MTQRQAGQLDGRLIVAVRIGHAREPLVVGKAFRTVAGEQHMR